LWIIFDSWTRVWYETAKGLCFIGQQHGWKVSRKEKAGIEEKHQHQISPTSGTAFSGCLASILLPLNQFCLLLSVPCFQGVCICPLRDNQILAGSPNINICFDSCSDGPETRRV